MFFWLNEESAFSPLFETVSPQKHGSVVANCVLKFWQGNNEAFMLDVVRSEYSIFV